MYALITGANSGIGRDMAYLLSKRGYDLILVARNEKGLNLTAEKLKTNTVVIPMDLSVRENSFALYEKVKEYDIEILINNAGFGIFGDFIHTNLNTELKMIDLNIGCVHILTKLFLKDFVEKNRGYILNVASLAAFGAGPLMAAYYGSKAYVLKMTQAIYQELRASNSNVVVSALCPGPVATQFNERAGVKFSVAPMKSTSVAKYAIKQMFKGKLIILPGIVAKVTALVSGVLPAKLMLSACYNIQKKKED